jgi:putative transposase
MKNHAIVEGSYYEIANRPFRCGGRGPGGRFVFHNVRGRLSPIYLSIEEIRDSAARGDLKVLDACPTDGREIDVSPYQFSIDALPDHEQKETVRRKQYMNVIDAARREQPPVPLSIRGLQPLLRAEHKRQVEAAIERGEEPPQTEMSVSAAIRWYRQFVASGRHIESLVHDRRGNTSSRLSPQQERLIDQTLQEHYLKPQAISVTAAHQRLRMLTRRATTNTDRSPKTVQVASYRAVLRRVQKLDKYDVMAARVGPQYAAAEFRTYGMTPPANGPLERVQMDHTQLDVRVGTAGRFVLRPWLTILYDSYSKAIVGYHLTEEPPSYRSVMECLAVAILPKDRLLAGQEDGDWSYPMCGVPSEILVDNGKEFHSQSLVNACADLSINLRYAPPRQPWFKAQVERTFGVLNTQLLHSICGRVHKGKHVPDPKDLALMSLENLNRILLQWIVTVYHQQPIPSLGETPNARWVNWMRKSTRTPIPLDEHAVRLALGQRQSRSLRPSGISLENIQYNNKMLSLLRRQHGNEKVDIKFDPGDMGLIYVLDRGQNRYFPVPALDPAVRGVSLFAHRLIHREQQARVAAGMRDVAYLDAKDALVETIEQLSPKQRQRVGKKAARFIQGLPADEHSPAKQELSLTARRPDTSEWPMDEEPQPIAADPFERVSADEQVTVLLPDAAAPIQPEPDPSPYADDDWDTPTATAVVRLNANPQVRGDE